MKPLHERLEHFHNQEKKKYPLLAKELEMNYFSLYNLAKGRVLKLTPDQAIKIDKYLTARGY